MPSNFVMALAMGRLSLISSGREKIVVVTMSGNMQKSGQVGSLNFKSLSPAGKWKL